MKVFDVKSFGRSLRQRRKELNYTQAFVSEVSGFSVSFISDLENGKSTAELGKAINAEICVEGIETQAQLDAIKGMGVKYVQGYYYDKPMRRVAFEEKYVYN